MPEFLNPVKDYNLSVPENGPNTLAILFVKARASSFTNSFAMMSFRIVSGIKSFPSYFYLAFEMIFLAESLFANLVNIFS